MNKPLYVLRAERDAACEELLALLTWHVEEAELRQHLDDYCCCNGQAVHAGWWIEDKIKTRTIRSAGQMLQIWADIVDAVKAVSEAERREVAELIACGGLVA
jgi:hypothetical protein